MRITRVARATLYRKGLVPPQPANVQMQLQRIKMRKPVWLSNLPVAKAKEGFVNELHPARWPRQPVAQHPIVK